MNPSVAKHAVETGQGYWKNFAAAPFTVGCLPFQVKLGLHPK
jgi:hypothetical protein